MGLLCLRPQVVLLMQFLRVEYTPSKQCFMDISLHMSCIIYKVYHLYMVMTGVEILHVHLYKVNNFITLV